LQNARDKFRQQGLGLAAISYDSAAILRDFSQRHGIDYPLLADPSSKIIRSFGVRNTEATGSNQGMAYPGYFYVTPNGKVKEKFFETAYTDRYTAGNLILKLFPDLIEANGREVSSPYIKLKLFQSDEVVVPGSRFTLAAEIALPADTHVYAPGVKGYKPIQLVIQKSGDFRLLPVRYPEPQVLFLPAIHESVPVYQGTFRLLQDVVLSADRQFASAAQNKMLSVSGQLFYQACDLVKCYLPQTSSVTWDVRVAPLDRERVPGALQHK
jgi:AhpC/TSA family protein/cytochrome c biogenesis DsbD-like protein